MILGATQTVTAIKRARGARRRQVRQQLLVFLAHASFSPRPPWRSDRVWQLFALRALLGVFAGYGALTMSMAAQSVPREKMAEAIGTVQTGHRLGPAIGPVIGGILAPLVGLRNAFLVASTFYIAAMLLIIFVYEEPLEADERSSWRWEVFPQLIRSPDFACSFGSRIATAIVVLVRYCRCWCAVCVAGRAVPSWPASFSLGRSPNRLALRRAC